MKPLQWVVTRHRIPVVLAATGIATVLLMLLRPGVAHALGVEDETAFVFNTFSFLVWGALVMWMCAGFTMLEAGSVRTKNASMICMKNIGLYSIAGLAYFIIGYNLMYVGVGRDLTLLGLNFGEIIGTFTLTYGSTAAEAALLEAEAGASAAGVLEESAYASMSDWFFQMVFVATTASIVSGALAERVKMWSFFLFTLFLTAFTYPLIGAWTWGGGWLNDLGFMDFAGSTIVHSTGGWAALAGLVVIGPRLGKFGRDGSVRPDATLQHSCRHPWRLHPLVRLVRLQRRLAACPRQRRRRRLDEHRAREHQPGGGGRRRGRDSGVAAHPGAHGPLRRVERRHSGPRLDHRRAQLRRPLLGDRHRRHRRRDRRFGLRLLERLKIDDVVGAVPAHLFAGIWGTLAASIAGGAQLHIQLLGVVVVGVTVFSISWSAWKVLDKTLGARVSRQVEQLGQDAGELHMESYPEFVLMPDPDYHDDYEEEKPGGN